jgi:hypothetical protein
MATTSFNGNSAANPGGRVKGIVLLWLDAFGRLDAPRLYQSSSGRDRASDPARPGARPFWARPDSRRAVVERFPQSVGIPRSRATDRGLSEGFPGQCRVGMGNRANHPGGLARRVSNAPIGAASSRWNVIQSGKFAPREQQRSSFMKLAIAGLLFAISAGSAIAQTTSPGTSTAPDSAATGTSPGTPPATPVERPRTQGNVPATTPGGPASSESSGPDPSKRMTPTMPDKQDPSPK